MTNDEASMFDEDVAFAVQAIHERELFRVQRDAARDIAARLWDQIAAVAALHANEDGYCRTCVDTYDGVWPCATAQAIGADQ